MKVRKTIDVVVPGLGEEIRKARKLDRRSLIQICQLVDMTPMNWYKIEGEETKALPIETLRKIEKVLDVNFGVELDN